jgi:hypothetical protein
MNYERESMLSFFIIIIIIIEEIIRFEVFIVHTLFLLLHFTAHIIATFFFLVCLKFFPLYIYCIIKFFFFKFISVNYVEIVLHVRIYF